MIALKLITLVLGQKMALHIPVSCYHVKGHGGLKKAVHQTCDAIPGYRYVMRSDIQSYYASVNFGVLLDIIRSYVSHPVLLELVCNALYRTETWGGIFYDYDTKGIPKGSPLSPLLGAIALLPLDKAMEQVRDIFYARFMDEWVILTKSKTALRKVVKIIHTILNALDFQLHPSKTYIGKISRGFNFLGYYMDSQKILPSRETIRRFHDRATALYEQPHVHKETFRRRRAPQRDYPTIQLMRRLPPRDISGR